MKKGFSVAPLKEGISQTFSTIATDKSISHRCALFSLLSNQPSVISHYLEAEDTLNTLKIVQKLGAKVEKNGNVMTITPPSVCTEPDDVLDCGNSGTAIRMLCGFLSSLDGHFVLTGDEYLRRRPMKRVADPLRKIGAQIDGRGEGNLAPLSIRGGSLEGFDYKSPIASAQVKSAMILAALRGKGVSTFFEPELSRDHTERMLKGMGAKIVQEGTKVTITPLKEPLKPLNIRVPSDPSSAFFFAVAAAITPHSYLVLENILLNETRIEAFKALARMGTNIEFVEKESTYDSMGDIIVSWAPLSGIEVDENISWLIDELPALAIAMSCADGQSRVRNAHELRVKESDRISSVVTNLRKCGIVVEEFEDGYEITGGFFKKAQIDSFGDHRIAMSFAIAGLKSGMDIYDTACIETSFPNFVELLTTFATVEPL